MVCKFSKNVLSLAQLIRIKFIVCLDWIVWIVTADWVGADNSGHAYRLNLRWVLTQCNLKCIFISLAALRDDKATKEITFRRPTDKHNIILRLATVQNAHRTRRTINSIIAINVGDGNCLQNEPCHFYGTSRQSGAGGRNIIFFKTPKVLNVLNPQ